jgi:hypothetical protein
VNCLCRKCFSSCESLQEVTFDVPSKLSRVESRVFSGCASLSAICIPNRVEIIGPSCFASCKSLRKVLFESPSMLSRIESDAFAGCSSLSLIRVPESHRALFQSLDPALTIRAIEDDRISVGVCGRP